MTAGGRASLGRYGRGVGLRTACAETGGAETAGAESGGVETGGPGSGTVSTSGTVSRAGRAVAVAAVLGLLSGCGLVGGPQTLRQDAPDTITVSSPMVEQGTISRQYTCHGAGKSPPILWSVMPSGTKSVALVVDDAAAPITPRAYWIVFDISPDTVDLQSGTLPTGARQARNSTGRVGYDPPCPAGARHQYRFTIYALSAVLHQPNGTPLKAAWMAIARDALARGRLTATAAP
jgi:Raf kinase inhibitor-like YbhB/YbcL family protein